MPSLKLQGCRPGCCPCFRMRVFWHGSQLYSKAHGATTSVTWATSKHLPPLEFANMTGRKIHHEWRCISPIENGKFSNVMLAFGLSGANSPWRVILLVPFFQGWMEASCFFFKRKNLESPWNSHSSTLPSRSCRIIMCHIFRIRAACRDCPDSKLPSFLPPPKQTIPRFLPKPLGNPESLEDHP